MILMYNNSGGCVLCLGDKVTRCQVTLVSDPESLGRKKGQGDK